MNDLQHIVWLIGHGNHTQAQRLAHDYSRSPQYSADDLRNARARGATLRTLRGQLQSACDRPGVPVEKVERLAAKVLSCSPQMRAEVSRTMLRAYSLRKLSSRPITDLPTMAQPRASSSAGPIADMPAKPQWTLCIDESGSKFQHGVTKGRGLAVGVLVPQGNLPSLRPDFHATQAVAHDLEQAVQTLRTLPIGVFGIDVEQVNTWSEDGWVATIMQLICWSCLLLPKSEQGKVHVQVLVEQRGPVQQGDRWPKMSQLILDRLAAIEPSFTDKLSLRITIVAKGDHPGLAWADLIAHLWFSERPDRRALLAGTDLLDSCLFPPKDWDLPATWSLMDQTRTLDTRALLTFYAQPLAPHLPTAVAERYLAKRLRSEPHTWRRALDHLGDYLDSADPDLQIAGRVATLLKNAAPANDAISPSARLALGMSQLTLANRAGEVENTPRLRALSHELVDEYPRLSLLADLQLASRALNRCNPDEATALMQPWTSLPLTSGGLRLRGRVESSLGQHAAFRGDQAAADRHFKAAVTLFERLSDPRIRHRELNQTNSYRAHLALDVDPSTAHHAVERVLGDLGQFLHHRHRSRWSEHLYARWLVLAKPGDIIERYVGSRAMWPQFSDFPGPLIQTYRALLLAEQHPEESMRLVSDAVETCFGDAAGPAMLLVGCALAVVERRLGRTWSELAEQLDAVAEDEPRYCVYIDALRRELDNVNDPTVVLQRGLPFGFR